MYYLVIRLCSGWYNFVEGVNLHNLYNTVLLYCMILIVKNVCAYVPHFFLHYHKGDYTCSMHLIASCIASRGVSYNILWLKCYIKCLKLLEAKHNDS